MKKREDRINGRKGGDKGRQANLSWGKGKLSKKVKPFNMETRKTIDREIIERAEAFIAKQAHSDKPFFAYVPYTAMHYPTLPHPDFNGKSGNGMYTDMLVQTDHYVGRLLSAIKEMELERDTLVVFASDNGPETPDVGDGRMSGWTGPWAGTYFTAMVSMKGV